MKNMNRSEQVAFGNFILDKFGVNQQVTAEVMQEFYDRQSGEAKAPEQAEVVDGVDEDNFVFPDDLDKIEPKQSKEEIVPPAPGGRKKRQEENPE